MYNFNQEFRNNNVCSLVVLADLSHYNIDSNHYNLLSLSIVKVGFCSYHGPASRLVHACGKLCKFTALLCII